ncbi:Uncharacterized protein QJS10_CPB17g00009 [Acorus calamus]|uniref:Uncharacterized protein n=1 Tax=Acorus calamus TaxID=4465 RepID=A0AAV9CWB3_ACOCL|nr:Uncharacterized protein QJS10_CPB17g00009 [Acorus calamus]
MDSSNPGTKFSSITRDELTGLSEPIRQALSAAPYIPPDGDSVSVKSALEALLPCNQSRPSILDEIRDFCLCCAALASAEGHDSSPRMSWIPGHLSATAASAFECLSSSVRSGLVEDLMPSLFPLLKGVIKDSSIDPTDDDEGEFGAASPVAYAVVAAYQFRWFVTQVNYPDLGKLCALVIPCALTSLDHWSPEVKGQGMISFIHLAKNVSAAELVLYEDVVLDVACRNIAISDELWHLVVEMSVLFLTCTQRRNPRSPWFEKILSGMLGHLERQPLDRKRYTAWLELIDPVLICMGLVLLAHFRRIFPLLFQWMHVDDIKTLLLVLERVNTIIKVTWIRQSTYFDRLVDELTLVYKESATRKDREVIRMHIRQTLVLLHECKGRQFETAWEKHKQDPNLSALTLDESTIQSCRRKLSSET